MPGFGSGVNIEFVPNLNRIINIEQISLENTFSELTLTIVLVCSSSSSDMNYTYQEPKLKNSQARSLNIIMEILWQLPFIESFRHAGGPSLSLAPGPGPGPGQKNQETRHSERTMRGRPRPTTCRHLSQHASGLPVIANAGRPGSVCFVPLPRLACEKRPWAFACPTWRWPWVTRLALSFDLDQKFCIARGPHRKVIKQNRHLPINRTVAEVHDAGKGCTVTGDSGSVGHGELSRILNFGVSTWSSWEGSCVFLVRNDAAWHAPGREKQQRRSRAHHTSLVRRVLCYGVQ
jgi:hypothetical protein